MVGGSGGSGFKSGGDGGGSIAGIAGSGGNISAVSIVAGSYFVAGNGGSGLTGGIGGSVIVAKDGRGGDGIKKGGAGGQISGFTPQFLEVVTPDPLFPRVTVLDFQGGDGGASVLGAGGKGGGVIGSDKGAAGLDYLLADGMTTTTDPVLGGILVDGAIIGQNFRVLQTGGRDFIK